MSRARFSFSAGRARVVTLASLGAATSMSLGIVVWLRNLFCRLDAAEERLRSAREMHDGLGNSLLAIALKAELAARLAPVDAERSAHEATDVQRLAGLALAEVRRTRHGTALS
jgi:two-component system, NarL family, sensor histidine kinase DesK